MTKIPVSDADANQLREFAITGHGLDLRANASRTTVIEALDAAGVDTSDGIDIYGAAPSAPSSQDEGFGKKESMPKEIAATGRVTVMIAKEKGGIDPVPVGVGGYWISIRRGQKVSIPRSHYEVLQNANELIYPVDENSQIIGDPSESPRFPVSAFA